MARHATPAPSLLACSLSGSLGLCYSQEEPGGWGLAGVASPTRSDAGRLPAGSQACAQGSEALRSVPGELPGEAGGRGAQCLGPTRGRPHPGGSWGAERERRGAAGRLSRTRGPALGNGGPRGRMDRGRAQSGGQSRPGPRLRDREDPRRASRAWRRGQLPAGAGVLPRGAEVTPGAGEPRGEGGMGGDGGGNCGGRGEAAELGGSRRPALVPAAGARSEGWRRDPDQGPGPLDEDADAWRPAAEAGPAVRWAEWKPRRPGVSGPCCSRLVLPRLALPARSGVGQPGGGQARPQMGSRGQDLTQFLNQICPQAQPWLRCLQEEARFLCSSQGVPLQDQGVPTQR